MAAEENSKSATLSDVRIEHFSVALSTFYWMDRFSSTGSSKIESSSALYLGQKLIASFTKAGNQCLEENLCILQMVKQYQQRVIHRFCVSELSFAMLLNLFINRIESKSSSFLGFKLQDFAKVLCPGPIYHQLSSSELNVLNRTPNMRTKNKF